MSDGIWLDGAWARRCKPSPECGNRPGLLTQMKTGKVFGESLSRDVSGSQAVGSSNHG